nr:MAG TPA: hypothetical protein [Bacteriophage sp.]
MPVLLFFKVFLIFIWLPPFFVAVVFLLRL